MKWNSKASTNSLNSTFRSIDQIDSIILLDDFPTRSLFKTKVTHLKMIKPLINYCSRRSRSGITIL